MRIDLIYKKLKNILETEKEKRFNIIAATLDSHNNIVAIGKNSFIKTHPLQFKYASKLKNPDSIYLHAEIAALIKSKKKIESIIVMRMNGNGIIRLAKPCTICTLALLEAKIKLVYYSNNQGTLSVLML
jgi:tRNA(Arg) A34 adenosine deaminase TadA